MYRAAEDSVYFEDVEPEIGMGSGAGSLVDRVVLENPYMDAFEFPPRTLHYWYTWLLKILEESCFEFGQRNLKEQLADIYWRARFAEQVVMTKDYTNEGYAELWDWARMLRSCQSQVPEDAFDTSIFNIRPIAGRTAFDRTCVTFIRIEDFRHAAIHRQQMRADILYSAMKLPTMLRDDNRANQIELVLSVVCDGFSAKTIDAETTEAVRRLLFEPEESYTTFAQALKRIQRLVEDALFNYATRQKFHSIMRNPSLASEDVELNDWLRFWPEEHPGQYVPWEYKFDIWDALRSMKDLRNVATHRSSLDYHPESHVRNAIKMAFLIDDTILAVEIEIVWQQWVTKLSRAEVIRRLRADFLENNGLSADPPEEIRARWEIAEVCMDGEEWTWMPQAWEWVTRARQWAQRNNNSPDGHGEDLVIDDSNQPHNDTAITTCRRFLRDFQTRLLRTVRRGLRHRPSDQSDQEGPNYKYNQHGQYRQNQLWAPQDPNYDPDQYAQHAANDRQEQLYEGGDYNHDSNAPRGLKARVICILRRGLHRNHTTYNDQDQTYYDEDQEYYDEDEEYYPYEGDTQLDPLTLRNRLRQAMLNLQRFKSKYLRKLRRVGHSPPAWDDEWNGEWVVEPHPALSNHGADAAGGKYWQERRGWAVQRFRDVRANLYILARLPAWMMS